MKEAPIIFRPDLIPAIISGAKTQTRRVVKHIPALGEPDNWCHLVQDRAIPFERSLGDFRAYCPYGQVGDCLVMKNGIRLEITDIRVERVQDITEEDAIAEGVTVHLDAVMAGAVAKDSPARMEFWALWQSIHKNDEHDWDANPWVWAIAFKRVEAKA